jgi:hypothetical protein
MADDDTRDDRLGRLLEVEPLDEVARRRLVTTAMRASAPPSRSRLVAAAAVVAIVVTGGIGYLALRGNDNTAPSATSARPSPGTPADRSGTEPPATAAGSAKSASPQVGAGTSESANADSAAPRDLGDVGDLEIVANLDRLRASTSSASLGAGAPQGQASGGASLVTQLRALACARELPNGTITAIGTAHFGTRDAIVVETSLPDGTTSLDAVLTHPCEVRKIR